MSSKKSSKKNVVSKVAKSAAKAVSKAMSKTDEKSPLKKTKIKVTQKTVRMTPEQKKEAEVRYAPNVTQKTGRVTPGQKKETKTTRQKVDQVFGNSGNIVAEKLLANLKITNNAMDYLKKATSSSNSGNSAGKIFGNAFKNNGTAKGANKGTNKSKKKDSPLDGVGKALGSTAGQVFSDNYAPKGNTIIKSAEKYLGIPYVFGGKRKEQGGIDCSGFVYRALEDSGYKLPETIGYTDANDLRFGGEVVDKSKLKPGDIVFYSDNPYGYASHVAIYVGDGKIIHSSGGRANDINNPGLGVSYQNLDYRDDYLEARRYR